MQITVHRHASEDGATIGTLAVDGRPLCFTLEDEVREVEGQPVDEWKIHGETAIPRGTYPVQITYSPHFARDLPLLVGVPGYDGVRIHPGNTAADTEGCLLVGYAEGHASIGRSRDAFADVFAAIYAAIHRGETVSLAIA
jgi:hypothetical protein